MEQKLPRTFAASKSTQRGILGSRREIDPLKRRTNSEYELLSSVKGVGEGRIEPSRCAYLGFKYIRTPRLYVESPGKFSR